MLSWGSEKLVELTLILGTLALLVMAISGSIVLPLAGASFALLTENEPVRCATERASTATLLDARARRQQCPNDALLCQVIVSNIVLLTIVPPQYRGLYSKRGWVSPALFPGSTSRM